jgi:hypothetical protein
MHTYLGGCLIDYCKNEVERLVVAAAVGCSVMVVTMVIIVKQSS